MAEREEVVFSEKDYEYQKLFVNKVKLENEKENAKTNTMKLMYISTFGCQMNVRDSETLKGMLLDMGYKETDSQEKADLIIYNTCCVRENAENKVYGNLGILKNLKKLNPNMKIILCGCMMQQDSVIENIKKKYKHVDIIFGTYNLVMLPQLLYTNMKTGEMIIDVWKEHTDIVEDLPSIREHKYKASVNIMYGCNNFCSYCIVPYVRGRERSREVADIIKEIQDLVNDSVVEITLLGQNVNSYGITLDKPVSFAYLLREINKIEGLERVRFLTSHPKDLSDELILAMKECDKVCKQLHIPFQSGSSNILKKMNRKYTKEQYLELIHKLKNAMPNIALSTDIIVGFPGETEEDFEDTIDVVKKAKFTTAFTFVYSKRTGTPAANMPNQVDESSYKNRFNRLIDTLNPILLEYNQNQIGKTLKVLVEQVDSTNDELITGRTEANSIVHFKGNKDLIGTIVNIKIIDCKTFYLIGHIDM